MELLHQAYKQVRFIYFKHIGSFGKKKESAQLDEKLGDDINANDYSTSFKKAVFYAITFSGFEDIGTCIDYCLCL